MAKGLGRNAVFVPIPRSARKGPKPGFSYSATKKEEIEHQEEEKEKGGPCSVRLVFMQGSSQIKRWALSVYLYGLSRKARRKAAIHHQRGQPPLSVCRSGVAISAAIYRGAKCPTIETAGRVPSGSR